MGKSSPPDGEDSKSETATVFGVAAGDADTASKDADSMYFRRLGIYSLARMLFRLFRTAFVYFVSACTAAGLILFLSFWLYGGWGPVILLHIAVLGLLYNSQDMLLYYPEQPLQSLLYVDLPSTIGLLFENITIRTRDGVQINMFLIKQPPSLLGNAPTVIYFHGNAGNIGHRIVNAHGLYNACKANVLLVEYRGFGRSRGYPSEAGLYLDAEAALEYVFSRSDLNQQKLVVFGRSLGGAVAIRTCSVPYYASRVACLVAENTFTSIPEMAYTIFNFKFLNYIPEWCYKNKYLSRFRIDKVHMPTLFVCGLKDNLVPPKMMLQLYNLSGSRLKRLALFQDGTHNETWQCRFYYETLSRFLFEVDQSLHGHSLPSEGTYPIGTPYQDGTQSF